MQGDKDLSSLSDSKKKYIWGTIGAGFLIYLVLTMILFNVPVETGLKYLLLNVISIFLPGLAILSFSNDRFSRNESLCMSYILGYSFIPFEYFFCELFNRKLSFTLMTAIVAVGSAIIIARKIKTKKSLIAVSDSENDRTGFLFLFIFIVLNLLSYSANHIGTEVMPKYGECRDMQYWLNNTVALKLSWPADNLFMSGTALNYHYFSNIPLALFSEVYGIDVFTLSFPLYGMTKAVFLVGAAQFLLNSLSEDRRVHLLGYLLLIFITGAEKAIWSTFVNHILVSPFGFDISYACGMAFFAFLLRQWKQEKLNAGGLCGMLLTWSMCVGSKAPIALVLMVFPAFLCLYWLIHREWALAFGCGLPILALFLIICKFCVGMFSVASGGAQWVLTLHATGQVIPGEVEAWDVVGRFLAQAGRKNPAAGVIVKTIFLNPALIFGSAVSAVWTLSLVIRKKTDGKEFFLRVSLTLTLLFGIVVWLLVDAGGNSETQFAMATFIPMAVHILISFGEYLKSSENAKYSRLPTLEKILLIVSIALLQMGVFRFSWSGAGNGAIKNAEDGLENLIGANLRYDINHQMESVVRRSDVEALAWIRDNTDKSALVMSDKAVLTGNEAFYMYGIFCERQQYIEGTDMFVNVMHGEFKNEVDGRMELVRSLFGNEEDAIEKAKAEGIDYIVQTVDVTPEFRAGDGLELVKSTETMNIYRVK